MLNWILGAKGKLIIGLALLAVVLSLLTAFKKNYDATIAAAAVADYVVAQAEKTAIEIAAIEAVQVAKLAIIKRERDRALVLANEAERRVAKLRGDIDEIRGIDEPECERVTVASWLQLNAARCAYNRERGYGSATGGGGACELAGGANALSAPMW